VLWVHYLPILTTIISIVFAASLYSRYRERRTMNLLWWTIGVACYGLGTLFESVITLFGNTVFLNKAWYIAGAVLGGYPLAQGSLYLSYSRRFANVATAISLPFIVITSALVALSPVDIDALQLHRPTGAILEWRWVRLMTPFINTYAVFFLIGGAFLSALRFYRDGRFMNRAIGNVIIAVGAILPGVGGAYAKAGFVEALYVGECIGLILIWIGERFCSSRRSEAASRAAAAQPELAAPR
jgi:hypothetical protein